MSNMISPILLDWLQADGVSVLSFAQKASELVSQGRSVMRGGEAWPASDGLNGRAVKASFGLGVEARWTDKDGLLYLEHIGEIARVITTQKLPLLMEHSLVGYPISQVAPFPFQLAEDYEIVDVYPTQAGMGMALCFKV